MNSRYIWSSISIGKKNRISKINRRHDWMREQEKERAALHSSRTNKYVCSRLPYGGNGKKQRAFSGTRGGGGGGDLQGKWLLASWSSSTLLLNCSWDILWFSYWTIEWKNWTDEAREETISVQQNSTVAGATRDNHNNWSKSQRPATIELVQKAQLAVGLLRGGLKRAPVCWPRIKSQKIIKDEK